MERSPAVAIVLSGVGARDSVEQPSGVFALVPGDLVLTSRKDDCVPGALVNSVSAVCAGKSAEIVRQVLENYSGVLKTLVAKAGILVNAKPSIMGCRIILDT